jgi:hypothetical protein
VHLSRAAEHRRVGEALRTAAQEPWAAVCYFYSAYHLVRYALRRDPIFDNPTALTRINVELYPDLRDISRHHGRKRTTPREWGINELVLVLYRPIAAPYNKLHQASIDIRYEDGPGPLSLDRAAVWLDEIWTAHDAGGLRATAPPDSIRT